MESRKAFEWQQKSEEILSGMKEWAAQHPHATFAEIERETMKRMAQLQARIMEDIAQSRADSVGMEEVKCAECGAKMGVRGEQERCLQAAGGQEVMLKRGYWVCPSCGAAIFPPG
jgi:DNA-directed RNA polymerase subunit RPC12/RpoP